MYRRTGVTTHVLVEALSDMIMFEESDECERVQPKDRDFMVVFPSKGCRDYADKRVYEFYEKLGGKCSFHPSDGCENLILTTPDRMKKYKCIPKKRIFYDPSGAYDVPAPMRFIRQIIILPDEDGYKALDRDGNLICLFNKQQVIDFMKMGKALPIVVDRCLWVPTIRRKYESPLPTSRSHQ